MHVHRQSRYIGGRNTFINPALQQRIAGIQLIRFNELLVIRCLRLGQTQGMKNEPACLINGVIRAMAIVQALGFEDLSAKPDCRLYGVPRVGQ